MKKMVLSLKKDKGSNYLNAFLILVLPKNRNGIKGDKLIRLEMYVRGIDVNLKN
jgi:hypothetical protein